MTAVSSEMTAVCVREIERERERERKTAGERKNEREYDCG